MSCRCAGVLRWERRTKNTEPRRLEPLGVMHALVLLPEPSDAGNPRRGYVF